MTMKPIPRQHEWRGICFRDIKGCEGMFRDISHFLPHRVPKGRARRRPTTAATWTRGGWTLGAAIDGRDGEHKGGEYEEGVSKSRLT